MRAMPPPALQVPAMASSESRKASSDALHAPSKPDSRKPSADQGPGKCRREKCNRTLNLNKDSLCPVHFCQAPHCANSKSSSDKVCEAHAANALLPLPKHFLKELFPKLGATIYLNKKTQVAQWDYPGPKGENSLVRTSSHPLPKPAKGIPTLYA